MGQQEFDYVIVGAGSAGCVLAARLTEGPNTVCLIEAGGPDSSVLIHAPAGVVAMVPTRINNYAYETVPQQGLNGRKGYQPRGKTLGGSSSINAMLYVRGNKWDYDQWCSLGNPGWAYADVLPLFKRAENNEQIVNEYHGQGGPLNVTYPRYQSDVSERFLSAAAMNGLNLNPDYNGSEQEGAFIYQATHKNGERCSAAKAYLTPNLSRRNLTVLTRTVTARVLFDGRRATGVAYYQGGELKQVRAPRGYPLVGRLRFAATADAFRCRRRRRASPPRHCRRPRPARCRQEPAGPYRLCSVLARTKQDGDRRTIHARRRPRHGRSPGMAQAPFRIDDHDLCDRRRLHSLGARRSSAGSAIDLCPGHRRRPCPQDACWSWDFLSCRCVATVQPRDRRAGEQ